MSTITRFSKSKDNLRMEGNRIISYSTYVATVDYAAGVVWAHGFWSMTTAKHIGIAARELGLRKEKDYDGLHMEDANGHVHEFVPQITGEDENIEACECGKVITVK